VKKIRVDLDLCVGHGRCYELAPEIFGEDERGHCRVHRTKVDGEDVALAFRAADNCPEGAIFVEADDGSGEG